MPFYVYRLRWRFINVVDFKQVIKKRYEYQFVSCHIKVNDTSDSVVSIIITDIRDVNTTLSVGCPTSVSISPSAGPFSAGDELTCSSNGNPAPSYQWTDSSGTVVSTTVSYTHLTLPTKRIV